VLLLLKARLEDEGFHVVYFESSQDLEMGDVDVGDILLAIARRVSKSLEESRINVKPTGFEQLLQGAAKVLNAEVKGFTVKVPQIGDFGANSKEAGEFSLAFGIGEITAKAKNSPELRSKLREYLEPRTTGILEAINNELLKPAKEKLKKQGHKGLVVIVDNLDRVESRPKWWGRPQQEYLFVDRGEQLRQLDCHVIYTMPLALMFSNDFNTLTQRFTVDPKVLPMVPVKLRDESDCQEGMYLLRQMVLARAFPNVTPERRLSLISEIFDTPDTLDYLCRISGGHVRELLRLLNDWIKKNRTLPLSREGLETVIRSRRNQMTLAITDLEWDLLHQVKQRKQVSGDDGYQVLVRSLFVYEYRDSEGSGFEVNPLLAEAGRLNL
jgi:hypothetical protein